MQPHPSGRVLGLHVLELDDDGEELFKVLVVIHSRLLDVSDATGGQGAVPTCVCPTVAKRFFCAPASTSLSSTWLTDFAWCSCRAT